MSTRKPGLQTCWPGFPTIPPTKSPTCCHGIGKRTWSPTPPLLPEQSSAEDCAYLGCWPGAYVELNARSPQLGRLEIMDTGRRRRWSEDKKLKRGAAGGRARSPRTLLEMPSRTLRIRLNISSIRLESQLRLP